MTTITASIVSLFNSQPQALSSIETTDGVPRYIAGDNSAVVVFDSSTANRGTDIAFDGETGQITVQADITYLVTARIETLGAVPTRIRWEETSSGNVFGVTAPAGETLTLCVTPGDENSYQLVAYTVDGSRFQYPAEIINASLTVQAVNGFEVA